MDREKVIKGFELFIKEFELFIKEIHPVCTGEGVELDMFRNVLAMLKEQEAPILTIDNAVSELMDRHYDRLKEQEEIKKLVRCNECKHRDPEDHKCDCGHDIQWQLPRADDWFCADGEEK